jgi:hypothetical protein
MPAVILAWPEKAQGSGKEAEMPNTKNERDAGFRPWEEPDPREGEICLAVLAPDGEEFSADDTVEFLNYLADNYPVVFNSMRLELATYQYDGSELTLN